MNSNKKFVILLEIFVITFLVMSVVPVCGLSDSSADISAYPNIVNPGDEITVTYSGAPGFEFDWIGLYKVGDPNEWFDWGYYLGGEKSGSLIIIAPQEPGDYEFRLFEDDGYTDIARSNIVTVQEGTTPISEEAIILFDENFDDGYASGFGNEVGDWEVHLLYPYTGKYTATTDTYRFSMAGDTNWQDYVIKADFFNAQDGGLLVRAQDQDNCIALIVRPASNEIGWNVRKGGSWGDFKGQVTLGHESGEELHVKVEVAGSEFKAYVNGVLKTTLNTTEYPNGKIGLYLCKQSDQYWDNVVVSSIGAAGPTPGLSVVLHDGDARTFTDPPNVIAYANTEYSMPPAEFVISTGGSIWRYDKWIALMGKDSWVEAETTVDTTSIGVQFWGDTNDGWARVLVDGSEVWTGDIYGIDYNYPGGAFVKYLEISGLTPGRHTIRVENMGVSGAGGGGDICMLLFGLENAATLATTQVPIDSTGNRTTVPRINVDGVGYALVGVMCVDSSDSPLDEAGPEFPQEITVDLEELGLDYVETVYLATQTAWSCDLPNDVKVATLVCEYAEGGPPTTLDLIMGVTTAEWAWENPTMAAAYGALPSHSMPPVITSTPTTAGSDEEYNAHTYATSVSLDPTRTLSKMRLELVDANQLLVYRSPLNPVPTWLGQACMAVTLEGRAATQEPREEGLAGYNIGELEIFDTDNDGTEDKWTHTFSKEEIADDLFEETIMDFVLTDSGLQGTIILKFENTGEDDINFDFTFEIPKPFATSVDDLEFSPTPDRVITPDTVTAHYVDPDVDSPSEDGPSDADRISEYGMCVAAWEGRDCKKDSGTDITINSANAILGSKLSYSQITTATGMWRFSKTMTYEDQIHSSPRPWPVFYLPIVTSSPAPSTGAEEETPTISIPSSVHHLGDQTFTDWEVPKPEGTEYTTTFSLATEPATSADLTLNVFQTNYDDPVLVNGQEVGFLCIHTSESWAQCTISIPKYALKIGSNTLTIRAGCRGTNYDDFMIKP